MSFARPPALAALVLLLAAGCTSTIAVPPEPTGAELDRLIALELDVQWQYVGLTPDAPRPTVDRIRIVSTEEAEQVHKQCMVEAGYDNSRTNTTFGADNFERLAIYTCSAQYPLPPASYGLFSEAQLEYLYDYYVEVTVPCIEASGVEVAEVPTRDEFVQQQAYLFETWVPYRQLQGDLSYLSSTKCRYVPEGFGQF